MNTVQELIEAVDTTALVTRSLSDWRPVLCQECQVYVFGETYLAKRFDQINYCFCEKDKAEEILIDNLYALLRFKYFPKPSEESDARIEKIVKSFTANLKTTLLKVSFDEAADCNIVYQLPDGCIAFRNGVFDFRKNDWFFKYDIINLSRLSNKIYMYRPDYIITWYMNYDFEPLPFDITKIPLDDFIEIMKKLTEEEETRNYCFELLYNISHGEKDEFSKQRFLHLCEILGYTILQSFSQHFVMLIGTGQNGKNSLFDGCFTHRIVPRPAANDMESIENDRFITGSLENKAHNIFLETSAKTYKESKMIKALTGSMYQTIESKGVSKYSSIINCKYIFAGNDQDKIKFSDTTIGFKRRINMLEIFYRWDSNKKFLSKGDYYDTTFSDSLSELKNNISNTTIYLYFGMYGIMSATKNFTSNFKFTFNDWNDRYADIDVDIKEKINRVEISQILHYLRFNQTEEGKTTFFDLEKDRLYLSKTMKILGVNSLDQMIKFLSDEESCIAYFSENDVYMSVKSLQSIIHDESSAIAFSQTFKKIYNLEKFELLSNNRSYFKCTFVKGKLKVLNKK